MNKICKKCGIEKDDTLFFRNICKECDKKQKREYYLKNKEIFKAKYIENKENILSRAKFYRENNKDKINERNKEKYYENRDARLEKRKSYNSNSKEKLKEYRVKYREKHRDKINARNKAFYSSINGKICRANSDSKRRALIKNGKVSAEEIKQLVFSSNNCYWCGCDIAFKFHIDHVIPLSKGGLHEIKNLVVSCPTCNIKKSNKMPQEFIKLIA